MRGAIVSAGCIRSLGGPREMRCWAVEVSWRLPIPKELHFSTNKGKSGLATQNTRHPDHPRHTKFVGLRDDKDPRNVMRET